MKPYFVEYLIKNREIIKQLTKRDINGRYKGSALGVLWTAINPVIMLCVYTLVFSHIFNAKWGDAASDNSATTFAINLFAGLIVFSLFAECATRAPTLITGNPNFVKKIIFPIHSLGAMVTGSACVHALVSTSILVIARIIFVGNVPVTIIALPLIWLPLVIGCLGMTWILSYIGVIIKDIGQLMNSTVSMLMFLSPIFYPSSLLPSNIKWMAEINPIASTIEDTRSIIVAGVMPDLQELLVRSMVSIVFCQLCFNVLKRSQKTLADKL